jgi:hypothetical protein
MAFVMLFGSFTVLGSAYQAYKGAAIANSYNDVDSPSFTLEQYASMALDELDRMLAKENIVLNIYIGTLDLASINTAVASLRQLYASVQTLLPMLGDAANLDISRLTYSGTTPVERSTATYTGNTSDLDMLYTVLNVLGDNAGIVAKYVDGSISLGIMHSFIKNYVFNVRELVIGLVYGLTDEGEAANYDYFDNYDYAAIPAKYRDANNGAITLAQALLNKYVLGKWQKLDEEFDDPYSYVDHYAYSFVDGNGNDVSNDQIETSQYDYYGWVHPDDWVTVGLGDAIRVAEGAAAPAPSYSKMDITTSALGYDFIEGLMQQAFNYVAVPVLNAQTRPWVRENCGVKYLESKTRRTILQNGEWVPNPNYDRDYEGEPFNEATDATPLNDIFNINGHITKATIPAGRTLVQEFNNILGQECAAILKNNVAVDGVTYSWSWTNGENSLLFQNVCNVARFVMCVTGDYFFPDFVNVPSAAEINAYSDQQVVALIARALLNNFVDWMYIDDSNQTIMDVAYAAVEQLAWQDIPQKTYTKPVRSNYQSDSAYYAALRDACLDILMDVAVYNLNQNLDMVGAKSTNPRLANGLLQYETDYEKLAIQVACWAVTSYAAVFENNLNLNTYITGAQVGTTAFDTAVANVTADQVWTDLDTILDSLLPVKGAGSIISSEISGQTYVVKSLLFDYILAPIYNLNATNFAKIFDRNSTGLFAQKDGVGIIMTLIANIFDLLVPGVFDHSIETLDELLVPNKLASMASDLVKSLGTLSFTSARTGALMQGRGAYIIKTALPIVCMVLGLSDDQSFEEMSIYMPTTLAANETVTFDVYNGSSGVNTGFTNRNGAFSQDELYTYVFESWTCKGTKNGVETTITPQGLNKPDEIAGGSAKQVQILGSDLTAGSLIKLDINYKVKVEDGTYLNDGQILTTTVYGYVGQYDKDDDSREISQDIADGRKIQYEKAIYISEHDKLSKIEGYNIRVKDNDVNANQQNPSVVANAAVTAVAGANNTPFVVLNGDAATQQGMTGQEGLYFFSPFKVGVDASDERYERQFLKPVLDADKKEQLDENGEVIVAPDDGVVPGNYAATSTVTVGGSQYPITTNIIIYYDYNLPSIFNSAVSANRQEGSYDMNQPAAVTAWQNYQSALINAASLVLAPKDSTTFDGAAMSNQYKDAALALKLAIKELNHYAKDAGVDAVLNAINSYSGRNNQLIPITETVDGVSYNFYYEKSLEYDDEEYIYFGMRDYVPHTYNRYKDARDYGNDLINQAYVIVPAPFTDTDVYGEGFVPTDEQVANRRNALVNAAKKIDAGISVSAIDAKYAEHMINLMGSRLIEIAPNNSKLNAVYTAYGNVDLTQKSYTDKSKEDYERATEFAALTLAAGNSAKPSQITEALGQLVYAYKRLVESCNFTALEAQIARAEAIPELSAESQSTYTPESFAALKEAYDEAKKIVADKEEMGLTDSNQEKIDKAAVKLQTAIAGLEEASAAEPTWAITEDGGGLFLPHTFEGDGFTPFIDTEFLEYYEALTPDGDDFDGFILGVGAGMFEEDVYEIFPEDNLSNCHVEVTMTDEDGYSTGSILTIVSDADDSVLATYVLVLRGDMNGDGEYDTTDVGLCAGAASGLIDVLYEPTNAYLAVAADVSSNGAQFDVSGTSVGSLQQAASFSADIDQETGTVA